MATLEITTLTPERPNLLKMSADERRIYLAQLREEVAAAPAPAKTNRGKNAARRGRNALKKRATGR